MQEADSLCCCEHPVNTHRSSTPGHVRPPHAGMPGLIAATIIGLQALAVAVLAVAFPLAAPEGASLNATSHVMFSVVTGVFALGLVLVARGLWRALSWHRTAAVVWLALLLPVGWAMVQADRRLVGVLILGSSVAGIAAVAVESRSALRP